MWVLITFLGCAIKSGVTMMKAEQAYIEANIEENRQAVYEWTMVESYMLKAREEYANSSFEDAENLANKAIEWMEEAKKAEKNADEKGKW